MTTLLKLFLYVAQGTLVYFTTGSVLPILALLVLTWIISQISEYEIWSRAKRVVNKDYQH